MTDKKMTKYLITINKIAELILDSADCKGEVIWLLKSKFKNIDQLNDTYNDLLDFEK